MNKLIANRDAREGAGSNEKRQKGGGNSTQMLVRERHSLLSLTNGPGLFAFPTAQPYSSNSHVQVT